MRYLVTILATREGKDNNLKDFLKDRGLFGKVELAKRHPLAQLGLVNGVPYMSSPKPQRILDEVYAGEEVRAVSCLPAADLERLNHSFFIYGQRFIEVVYTPDEPEPDVRIPYLRDPAYRKRVVVLRPGTPNRDFQRLEETEEPHPEASPLILNPQVMYLDRKAVEALVRVVSLVEAPDAAVLPPYFAGGIEETYYSGEGDFLEELDYSEEEYAPRRETRRAMATACGLVKPHPDEPAMLSLWRLADEPLVLDYLREGSSLEVPGVVNEPTLATLQVFQARGTPADPLADYRQRFVLRSQQPLPGPPWIADLGRAIQEDLQALVPGGLQLTTTTQRNSWVVEPPLRGNRPRGAESGSWQRLEALRRRIGQEKLQTWFHDQVLWPSRGGEHDLAEQLFMMNFFRCPSTLPQAQEGWRVAMAADLLRPDCELAGNTVPVGARIKFWQSGNWPRLSKPLDRGAWILEHLSSDSVVDVYKWRYLMPLESIVCTGRMFRLERPFSALDRGFVLSG